MQNKYLEQRVTELEEQLKIALEKINEIKSVFPEAIFEQRQTFVCNLGAIHTSDPPPDPKYVHLFPFVYNGRCNKGYPNTDIYHDSHY